MKSEVAVSMSGSGGLLLPYFELLKPRVSFLVVLTTAAGFTLASTLPFDWPTLIWTVLATALLSGGSVCLNQVMERHLDARMTRTAGRPLPTARVSVGSATGFGIGLILAGTIVLLSTTRVLPAALGLASAAVYLFAYTPLKRRTALCTTVGAVPGAIPPLIGWTAAGGQLNLEAWMLFGILFLWQYPHFLAIAWIYRDDYRKGAFKMLPLDDPSGKRTARQIVLFAVLLCAVSLFPWAFGLAGRVYLFSALLAGAAFLATTLNLLKTPTTPYARYVMRASVFYLPWLLAVLVVDRL